LEFGYWPLQTATHNTNYQRAQHNFNKKACNLHFGTASQTIEHKQTTELELTTSALAMTSSSTNAFSTHQRDACPREVLILVAQHLSQTLVQLSMLFPPTKEMRARERCSFLLRSTSATRLCKGARPVLEGRCLPLAVLLMQGWKVQPSS
jgi:hypothetical protein